MAFKAESAARMVVMMGMRLATAAVRILISSSRGVLPLGVLMMKCMSLFLM